VGFLFEVDGRACSIRIRRTKNEGGPGPPEGSMMETLAPHPGITGAKRR